jgi:hypothetical protein
MTKKQAEKKVDAIIEDLAGRNGIGNEWEEIDEDTQEEIRECWIEILMEKA